MLKPQTKRPENWPRPDIASKEKLKVQEQELSNLAHDFIKAAAEGQEHNAAQIFTQIFDNYGFKDQESTTGAFEFAVFCIQHPDAHKNDAELLEGEPRELTDTEKEIIERARTRLAPSAPKVV